MGTPFFVVAFWVVPLAKKAGFWGEA